MGKKRKQNRPQPQGDKPKPPPKVATELGALLKRAGLASRPKTSASPAATARAAVESAKTTAVARPVASARHEKSAAVATPKEAARAGGSAALSTTELRMLNDAYAGVRKLAAGPARAVTAPMPPRPHGTTKLADVESQDAQAERAARDRLSALVAGAVRFQVQRQDEFVEGLRSDASPKILPRLFGKGFMPEATLDLHGRRAAEVAQVVSDFVRAHHRRGARHLLIITGKGLHSEHGVPVLGHALVEALVHGGAAPLVLGFASAHLRHGGSGALAVLLQS